MTCIIGAAVMMAVSAAQVMAGTICRVFGF